jgi:hypothetical protein
MNLSKHVDTIVIMSAILGCFLWMNGKFNDIEVKFNDMERRFDARFAAIEKEITMVKTVLIMRGIMPTDFACEKPEHKREAP